MPKEPDPRLTQTVDDPRIRQIVEVLTKWRNGDPDYDDDTETLDEIEDILWEEFEPN